MQNGALTGLKVLDFTHFVSGPYCTKLLADYGAEVIKVEPPGGDGARRMGPFPNDKPDPEQSGLFLHLNTNKRSIVIDLKQTGASGLTERLALWADVVVESFRPGVADRLGIGFQRLISINPRLNYTSISNFGQNGPYRDYRGSEIVFYGMGGEMHSTGLADREPLKLGGQVGLYQAGAVAAVATMGATLAGAFDPDDQAEETRGQHIDIAILETQLGSVDRRQSALLAHQYTGELSHRPASGGSGGFPNAVYPCADGYFQINGSRMYFPRAVAMLGNPSELTTERWQDPARPRVIWGCRKSLSQNISCRGYSNARGRMPGRMPRKTGCFPVPSIPWRTLMQIPLSRLVEFLPKASILLPEISDTLAGHSS